MFGGAIGEAGNGIGTYSSLYRSVLEELRGGN